MPKNAVKNSGKTQPGWQVPIRAKQVFDQFCVEKGVVAQEDSAGALILWTRMPAQIREWAKLEAKGQVRVDENFWVRLEKLILGSIPMLLETRELPGEKGSAESA